ncbi:MAG: SIMPL domain-containing protein [Clostridia bacterium]|nr:SIMPL domain-containing protein [Clostridia bacterium]
MMNEGKKMLAALLAAVMMLGVCGAAAEGAYATPAPVQHSAERTTITVQGSAQILADPDEVSVTASASVTAGTVGAAQEAMNAIVAAATEKLLALGVLDEDIVTADYNYYPRYNYDTNVLTGYEANHTLTITCRDVEMLDSVIGALTDSGVTNIYSVQYDISTRSELYQQALDLAIQRAEQKALRMAQTSGLMITGVRAITENGGYHEGYAVSGKADGAVLRAQSVSTGIRSGSVGVSAGVTVVYEAGAY